jgi:hypothetical protein
LKSLTQVAWFPRHMFHPPEALKQQQVAIYLLKYCQLVVACLADLTDSESMENCLATWDWTSLTVLEKDSANLWCWHLRREFWTEFLEGLWNSSNKLGVRASCPRSLVEEGKILYLLWWAHFAHSSYLACL